MAGIKEYEIAWIGESVETDFNSITLTPSELISCRGEIGDFQLEYKHNDRTNKIKVSNIVINLPHFAEMYNDSWSSLFAGDPELKDDEAVIILQDYPQLSAAAVSHIALKKALKLKREDPEREVYYLYQAMRFMEDNDQLYEKARENNIVFLKFDLGRLEIPEDNKVKYQREDIDLELSGNIIAAPELKPPPELKRLKRIFNLPEGYKDYLQPDNIYLQPTLSGKRGVYLLRGSRGPTSLTYYREELDFTLAEIARNLQGVEPVDDQERVVDDQKCIVCYTCYRVCPHGAIERDEELNSMKILNLACQGCNLCISRCPSGAISLKEGELLQKNSDIKEEDKKPGLIICENSAEIAAENYQTTNGENLLADFEVMVVPCVSTVKREDIFSLLTEEREILILGCIPEACKHITGHERCQQVVDRVKNDLEKLELSPERINYYKLSPRMAADLAGFLADWKGEMVK